MCGLKLVSLGKRGGGETRRRVEWMDCTYPPWNGMFSLEDGETVAILSALQYASHVADSRREQAGVDETRRDASSEDAQTRARRAWPCLASSDLIQIPLRSPHFELSCLSRAACSSRIA